MLDENRRIPWDWFPASIPENQRHTIPIVNQRIDDVCPDNDARVTNAVGLFEAPVVGNVLSDDTAPTLKVEFS